MPVTSKRLKEVLRYDPDTGQFTWLVQRNQMAVGSVAGTNHPNGARMIWIDGVSYYAHRLAWLYVYGKWPTHDIDHIDRDRSNNRIRNLRDVTESVNLQNQCLTGRKNSSGLLGVCWYSRYNKWNASIRVNGRSINLGYFCTKEEAHALYVRAKTKHHPGFVKELT